MNVLAPAKVTVTPLSTSAVTVATEAAPDSPGVLVYRVSIDSKSCNAPVSGSAPYTCTITTLPGGVLRTAQVVACLGTGDCSTSTSGQGYTFPDGKSFTNPCSMCTKVWSIRSLTLLTIDD